MTGMRRSTSASGPCFSSPRHTPRHECTRSPELERAFHGDRVVHPAARKRACSQAANFSAQPRISGSVRSARRSPPASRAALRGSRPRARGKVFSDLGKRRREGEERGELRRERLVEATPISGPARVRNLSCELRTSADSGTLQMASENGWPILRAWMSAAIVSAVSPDCEITMTSVRGLGTGVAVAVLRSRPRRCRGCRRGFPASSAPRPLRDSSSRRRGSAPSRSSRRSRSR